ncbi:MAG: VOC family protein [Pseudomonadota bacterium]
MHTKINWFEIPATDFKRAIKFYETLFDTQLLVQDFTGFDLAVFTTADGEGVGGVICGENYTPGGDGAVLYLDASPSIDAILARVETAGGSIKMGKIELPKDLGFVAYFIDTEGNRLALHAMA